MMTLRARRASACISRSDWIEIQAPASCSSLWIIDPAGRHIATIHVPQQTANHAWGGPDRRNLYIQASTSVYMIPTHVGPHRESFMTSH